MDLMIIFPWPAVLALAAAVLAMSVLYAREHACNRQLRITILLAVQKEINAKVRAHEDGVALGLRRGYGEAATAALRAWGEGRNPVGAIRAHALLSLPASDVLELMGEKKAAA